MLVVHAWWGLNNFFKSVCDRLAAEGFVAFAPDLFEGKVATTIAQAKRLRARPKREPTYKTLIRAIDALKNHPSTQGQTIGVIGFSMGAHWAHWLSQRPELSIGAAVTFYGVRNGDFSQSRAAFLGHFAEEDDWVSPTAPTKVKKGLESCGKTVEFYTYPQTHHWFFEQDRKDVYDAQAADLAWQRTLTFLRKHLKD